MCEIVVFVYLVRYHSYHNLDFVELIINSADTSTSHEYRAEITTSTCALARKCIVSEKSSIGPVSCAMNWRILYVSEFGLGLSVFAGGILKSERHMLDW